MIKIISLLLSLMLSIVVSAAPTIDSITLSTNKAITLSGQNFQVFGGEVLSYDNFEQDAVGQKIHLAYPTAGFQWKALYNYNGLGIVTDDTKAVSGSKSIKVDWSIDPYSIRAFGWYDKGLYSQIYISYYRWMQGDFLASTCNHKQFYFSGNNSNFPQVMSLLIGGTSTWGVYNNVGDGSVSWTQRNNPNTAGWTWANTSNKFQRWEYFFKLNSPSTVSNGVVQTWVDGVLGINTSTYRIGYVDGAFKDFSLGHMAQGFFTTAKAWFDDIYIATTPARVELCDSPIYTSCTRKDIQYVDPIKWSDTSIQFTLHNLEAYPVGSTYLYVIDKDGIVSASFKIYPI